MSTFDRAGVPSRTDPNCRTCTDFKSWSKKQGDFFQNMPKKQISTNNSTTEANDSMAPRDDCPLDKNQLGRATWSLLHTMAATYPDKPTEGQKQNVKTFFNSLSKVYPCEYCSKDFQDDLRVHPIDATSQSAFSMWLCMFHNRVNGKLNKPRFDCTKVNERWRDGWLDGSCD